MQVSQAAIDLIKEFEGCYLEQYICPAGVSTIGIGTTRIDGKPVPEGLVITETQAEQYLAEDLSLFESAVERLVTVPLTQSQFDALVSFTYNVGQGNLQNSTLLRKLNSSDYPGAANEFPRWNRGGGKVLPGLTRRREAERELFLAE